MGGGGGYLLFGWSGLDVPLIEAVNEERKVSGVLPDEPSKSWHALHVAERTVTQSRPVDNGFQEVKVPEKIRGVEGSPKDANLNGGLADVQGLVPVGRRSGFEVAPVLDFGGTVELSVRILVSSRNPHNKGAGMGTVEERSELAEMQRTQHALVDVTMHAAAISRSRRRPKMVLENRVGIDDLEELLPHLAMCPHPIWAGDNLEPMIKAAVRFGDIISWPDTIVKSGDDVVDGIVPLNVDFHFQTEEDTVALFRFHVPNFFIGVVEEAAIDVRVGGHTAGAHTVMIRVIVGSG